MPIHTVCDACLPARAALAAWATDADEVPVDDEVEGPSSRVEGALAHDAGLEGVGGELCRDDGLLLCTGAVVKRREAREEAREGEGKSGRCEELHDPLSLKDRGQWWGLELSSAMVWPSYAAPLEVSLHPRHRRALAHHVDPHLDLILLEQWDPVAAARLRLHPLV